MKTAYEQGVEWGSCPEALEMRKNYTTQADWWKACKRGDWLIWQLEKLSNNEREKIKFSLLRVINIIADRAVIDHALHCGVDEIEKWAINWLNGSDRSFASAASAESAAWAAWAASAARAAWAASAARAVRTVSAAWAVSAASAVSAVSAAWAARAASAARAARAVRAVSKKELKLQADDIHREIPEWPGT